jgi:capsular exopolysaccharide synthesis family protein
MTPTPSTTPAAPTEAASDTPDLRAYLAILWRRKWTFLACVVAIPVAVYLISSSAQKRYQSRVLLQIQAQAVDSSLFSGNAPTTSADQTLNATARLIATTGVAAEAAKRLRPRPATPGALLGAISAKPDTDSGFITITATSPEPRRAADVANAFASAVVATRARKARSLIDAAIRQIENNLNDLSPSDDAGRLQLSQQLQRLRALRAAQGNNAQVVEPATPSSVPVSPHPARNTILAAILAVLLGAGLVLLLDRLDRRIRRPDDFEKLAGAPLLGIVPESAFPGSRPNAVVLESFQTLRASLTYFNIDRQLKSVVVTSPLKGDGKTTVATNLALALARAGKDIVLVEADLRHPAIVARTGISVRGGLSAVLVGERNLEDALVEIDVETGRLRVLPSGPVPPNPSELIASEAMSSVLDELSSQSDLVLIDTPPVLVVSDALPLFKQVSGIVLIGRINRTTRESMRRLRSVIGTAAGSVLGVVVTGAKSSGLYGYGPYGGYEESWSDEEASAPVDNGRPADTAPRISGRSRGKVSRRT